MRHTYLIRLIILLSLSGCYEPPALQLNETCHPTAPECAQLDFDGDGIPNGRDRFPLDERCAEETDEHCGACERACGARFACVSGICVPSSEERCDGEDNDIDGVIDESIIAPLSSRPYGVCSGLTKLCDGAKGWIEPSFQALDGFEDIETLCDGLDNDCDGRIDETLIAPLATPQLGVCQGSLLSCEGESGWLSPDRRLLIEDYEVSETICDNLDNDCDGQIDERVDGGSCQTGALGRCAAGQERCLMGELSCEPIAEAIEERCNFVDDDCDGRVDEELVPPLDEGALGVCRSPSGSCEGGEWIIRAVEALPSYEVVELSCDGLDNDCDGLTDESLPSEPCIVNETYGPCTEGQTSCVDGSLSCLSVYQSEDERCDGLDNDCDGAIDEALILPLYPNQLGVCLGLRSLCGGEEGVLDANPTRLLSFEEDESSCDGLDNDCDGLIDESYLSEICFTDDLGVCRTGISLCVEGRINCLGPLATAETCDGLDNDCDGAIDEDLSVPLTPLTEGVCEGQRRRCGGEAGWLLPDPPLQFESPFEQSCDGIDNDCDGIVDEGLNDLRDPSPLLLGVCQEQSLVCDAGHLRAPNTQERSLQSISFEEDEVSCDGLDNDCDGLVDEGPSTGWGECQSGLSGPCIEGRLECKGAHLSCEPLQVPLLERCDQIDNDCDGLIDEALTAGPCSVGIGACAAAGEVRCLSGTYQCDATPHSPQDERCNGIDDDCDGDVDEQFALSEVTCSTGIGACSRNGLWSCDLGTLSCSAIEGPSGAERCDGLDNDCDGEVDEDYFQLARPCVSGVGECEVRGLWQCSELGELQCGNGLSEAELERCDGLDNDCDGQVDEHITQELCDGTDNDCDGEVDESLAVESCNQLDDDCDGYVDESPCAPCLEGSECPSLQWYTLPSGDFLMGGELSDQQPIHPVRIEGFQLSDEITVSQYQRCVSAGICSPAGQGGDCNAGQIDRGEHPINCVSWLQAHLFAYWVGGRLPSESQWEYAARGAGLNALTPWGGSQVSCNFALLRDESGYACGLFATLPIRSPQTINGRSPQGLADLIGNVAEWVEDDYVSGYQNAPADGSPLCDEGVCDAQGEKVYRGGGWRTFGAELNNRSRASALYLLKSAEIGFRVLRSGP